MSRAPRRRAAAAGVALAGLLGACGSAAGPELVGAPVELPTPDPRFVPDPAIRAAEVDPSGTPRPTIVIPRPQPNRRATPTPEVPVPTPADATMTPATPASTPTPTEPPTAAVPAATATVAPASPSDVSYSRPAAPNGRIAPDVPTEAAVLASLIERTERALRDPATPASEIAELGHIQQITYRKLAREDAWDAEVFALLPEDLQPIVETQVRARRSLRGLASGFSSPDFIPAWEIVAPAPAADLLSYYQEAEAATGIEWEYLAAINLLETGMGRIRGLSGAGAQGPMQFIPTTWDEVGEGDINDPRDAILAAARYLVRRGGPADMPGALWGYNNSDEYVASVSTYASLLRADPGAFTGLYNWQIYFATEVGDVWLPEGTSTPQIDVYEFLAAAPWSQPDPGLEPSG